MRKGYTPAPNPLLGLDLNLLLVLDALLGERHVTRAGLRIGLSQPATSRALSRLREHFHDPLLVREGNTLVPTSRAEELAAPLTAAITALQEALTPPTPFDPSTARRTFTLATADYGQFVVLPPLISRLQSAAPGVDLVVLDLGSTPVHQALSDGLVDVVIAPRPGATRLSRPPAEVYDGGAHLYRRHLFDERFVCLVRDGHPRVKSRLSLETFVDLPHAFIAPRGTPGGIVDDVLEAQGLTRRVAVMVQSFLVAPWLVAQSDLIITLAERLARALSNTLPLRVLKPPLVIPDFAMELAWHERRHLDPAHRWLRAELVASSKGV